MAFYLVYTRKRDGRYGDTPLDGSTVFRVVAMSFYPQSVSELKVL